MEAVVRSTLEKAIVAGMERASRDVMQWGEDDCALWCADILRTVLPYDPAAEFRGHYKTARGARRVLGSGGLEAAIRRTARRNGWKRIDPNRAQPGDIGMGWTEAGDRRVLATFICRANGWFVARNERGFTATSASNIVICWSVLDDVAPGKHFVPRMHSSRVQFVQTAVPQAPVVAVLAAALGGSAIATFVASAIVYGTLSIGVSLLSSLFQKRDPQNLDSSLSNTQGVQITERQPLPYKRVIVGSAFVGGALFFEQVKAPFLYMGVLINHGDIAGVDKILIGTNELGFANGITQNAILTPTGVVGQPDYPNRLRVSLRYGSTTQAIDPLIAADFTSMSTEFRQRGVSTAVMRYHFGSDQTEFLSLWGQVQRPNAYFVVRGVRAYDPRDPDQLLDDETTWKWTNNASLIQAYYLSRDWGGRIPKDRIVWSKIVDAANYDDELIACKDGTFIKRHTIDGVITLNQRPSDVMQMLLTANRGRVLESAGRVWIASSRPKTPIATIHDGNLVGGVKYQAAKAKRDLVNKLQVRFVAPDQDYQIVDGPILSRTDLQTLDQEVLPATLPLNFTQDHRRAQRLQKSFLSDSRLGRTITCAVDLSILGIANDELIDGVVTFDSALFSIANGTYLVTSVGFSDDCTNAALALTEYDASIETDWDPATDEQDFDLASLNVS